MYVRSGRGKKDTRLVGLGYKLQPSILQDSLVSHIINPRRACAARVTVVGHGFSVCQCVCVSTLIQATRRPIN